MRWGGDSALATLALALLAARVAVFAALPLPAPVGDGVLFASVAQYHCASGVFETPIFPLDPTGAYRYVWHGIAWPGLLSLLNPDCSLQGGFIALAITMGLTALALAWGFGSRHGVWATALLIAVVGALQAKLGFRPETLAMPIALLGHAWRVRGMAWAWVASIGLLAWTQPTACLLAAAHALLTLDAHDQRALWRGAPLGLPAVLAVQGLIVLAYPFPLADLLAGLSQQGSQFAGRQDGGLLVYFVRSDFFPLLGLAMAGVFALACWRRPALLLLLPLVAYFGLRVPPAWYNLAPLFVVLLASLRDAPPRAPGPTAARTTALLCALLASAGLAQSLLRDGVSAWRERPDAAAALGPLRQLQDRGVAVCGVPPWLTLLLPANAFEPAYEPRLKGCPPAGAREAVDLVPMTALHARADADACRLLPRRADVPAALDRLFRSGSGYGVALCPALRPPPIAPR